jgi:hypothetical protein
MEYHQSEFIIARVPSSKRVNMQWGKNRGVSRVIGTILYCTVLDCDM